MEELGPFSNTEPVADCYKQKDVLEAILEYFGMDFWELVAGQTNLKSIQCTFHSLQTTAAEFLHFTRIRLVMETQKLLQAKLYWSRLLQLSLICYTVHRDRYVKLRIDLNFVNIFDDHDPDDELWKIRPLIYAMRKKCVNSPYAAHLSVDDKMILFSGKCVFKWSVPSKPHPLALKNLFLATSDGMVLDFCIYVGQQTVPKNDLNE
jgi:hypothetical protein